MLLNESHRALIALLHAEEASCVVRRGDTVRLFRRRGVKDLYDLLKHDPALLDGAFVGMLSLTICVLPWQECWTMGVL